MPVMFIMDFAGATTEQYDQTMELMALNGKLPPRALFHSVGEFGDGLRVIDVWESADAFQQYAEDKIMPLTAQVGLSPPQVSSHEVAGLRRGDDRDVTFVQYVTLPGVDGDGFSELDAQVTGGAAPDGCVFHVNGPAEDGYFVMDAWASKAERDDFIENKIKPAVQAAGLDAMPSFEDLELHNSLRNPATSGAAA